ISTLDGLGREVTSARVVPYGSGSSAGYDYEISRTDTTYDADNNVQETQHWERIVGASATPTGPSALGYANAVRTATVNWYDAQKRLVATAELGTEASTPGFSSSGSPPPARTWFDPLSRPSITPGVTTPINRAGTPESAPLTIYRYDRRG